MTTATHKSPSSKKTRETDTTVSDKIADTAQKWKYQGTWSAFKGKARRLWGNLTDDDFDVAEGSYEEIIGRIQKKSGESLDFIRSKLFRE